MVPNVGLLRSNIFIKMSVVEMRILRFINENTWKGRIRNEEIRLKIGIAPIDEKIKESHLKWFDHV